jgi:hypothetical protein
LPYQVHGSTEPVLYTLILLGLVGGHSRIRTYDFHRVKVGSNQTAAHSKGVISRYSR